MDEACYMFHEQRFNENVKALRDAYAEAGLNLELAYSVKTNPHPSVLRAAKNAGMMAEVVSYAELELAKDAGFGHRIVYNGVIPHSSGKFQEAAHGAVVNLDSLLEVKEVGEIAQKEKATISIGLRVNVDIGNGIVSRFGIEYGSKEWSDTIRYLGQNEFVRINCIHHHVSGCRQLDMYEKRAEKIINVARELRARYVDLGSGFYGPMHPRLKMQFGTYVPSFAEYASAVKNALAKATSDGGYYKPTFILEPGKPVVADTVSVFATVMNIRTIMGRTAAAVNVSEYDFGFLAQCRNVPFDVIDAGGDKVRGPMDICGYTCKEDDVLYYQYNGELAIGDKIVFRNAGAYSASLSNDFILPRLSMIVV